MKDQRGTVTFPWPHSMDVEDQSSGFLDPNPVFPPFPAVLFLPSQTQAGEARLRAMGTPPLLPCRLCLCLSQDFLAT